MKKTKIPQLVAILILTLITVVMWVSFSVYRSITSAPPPAVPAEVAAPLTPTLDAESMNQIETRLFIDDSQVPDNVVTQQSLSTTPIPVATPLPQQTPIPAEPTVEPEQTSAPEI